MTQNFFETYIAEQLLPSFEQLCLQVSKEQAQTRADGVLAFNPRSQFVEGKVINAFSYLVCARPKDERLMASLRQTFHFVAGRKFETWGTLHCLTGIYRLQKAGLLDQALAPEDLPVLKKKLTWRQFVDADDHFKLINKPTNYYGVAFGVARYRELLGWSPNHYSDTLFDLLIEHIHQYSGKEMFMDETKGQGRFDRYTLLIPAEISNLLMETKRPVPEFLQKMLAESVRVCLLIANPAGNGIAYGRSIGAYGDTAVLEILSIADRLGLLHGDDQTLAFAFAQRLMTKYADFWFDQHTGHINMWDGGRQTDGYRNKNRILGETVSVQLQILHSIENFQTNPLKAAVDEQTLATLTAKLPTVELVNFDNHHGPKSMVVVRHHGRVFMVPFVNGGEKYFKTSPYLPMPHSSEYLEYTPDRLAGNLVPLLAIQGGEYLPAARFSSVTAKATDDGAQIDFTMETLCRIEANTPQFEAGYHYAGTYLFNADGLTISGHLTSDDQEIDDAMIQLPLFAKLTAQDGDRLEYSGDGVRAITVSGFDDVTDLAYALDLPTPHGTHQSSLVLKKHVKAKQFDFSITVHD